MQATLFPSGDSFSCSEGEVRAAGEAQPLLQFILTTLPQPGLPDPAP